MPPLRFVQLPDAQPLPSRHFADMATLLDAAQTLAQQLAYQMQGNDAVVPMSWRRPPDYEMLKNLRGGVEAFLWQMKAQNPGLFHSGRALRSVD